MTRFLLEGWKQAGALPGKVLVCESDQAVFRKLQSGFAEVQASDLSQAGQTGLIILAVYPPTYVAVFMERST